MELVKINQGKIEIANDIKEKIVAFEEQKARMDLIQQQLKEELLKAMEENGVLFLEFDNLKIQYKKSHERNTIDTKALKEELPEVAYKYSKTTNVKSSVMIKVD